jgi:hypothetical protein
MLSSLLISLAALATTQQPQPALVQKSSGWCSPNIANVIGNVTVNCIGVDPRALKHLNAELDRKNLQLADRIRDADDWTAKYKELEAQLGKAGNDSVLSQQAEEYLHEGELEKAGAVLDQILGGEEKQIDRIAANHYNRALVFELQFRPLEALPHFEKAYQYRPEEWQYGQRYSGVLLNESDFERAEPVLLATLERARQQANVNPEAYPITLASMGILYHHTQRPKEAEAAFHEVVNCYRQLAKVNPVAYQPELALALNNQASLYRDTNRTKEADCSYREALAIYRQLAKAKPAAYQWYLAWTLNNQGVLYYDTGQMKEAESALQEALQSRRQLAKTNPAAYQADLAWTLNNLAYVHLQIPHLSLARTEVEEALSISRQLWDANHEAAGDLLARSLGIDAMLLNATHHPSSALCPLLREAEAVAYDPQLKKAAADKQAEFCTAPQTAQ